ncbi:type VII secretion target [Williamsia sterculiae]|uniref:Excreted virulence factor EspC, type VII ESX diderm n=1 Tax=Williamsia sterculiae TaxID=1344003 RepID=A0A1N7GSK9_9NOCA|nr:type VII secretion target [Williamsia sterculiae]SIS15552.1 Excreted virulence factor EspC, type VII ESX diderm [Williamsia sterculiae]
MSEVTAVPAALETFGSAAAAMSATVASAGSINAAANTAVMAPVFGLIGQEFLAAFVQAQASHLFSVGQLAAVHAGTAASMFTTAQEFQSSDTASGTVIKAAGEGQ